MFWPKLPRARARNQQERINPVRRASRRGRYRGIGQDAVGTHCAFAPKHFTNASTSGRAAKGAVRVAHRELGRGAGREALPGAEGAGDCGQRSENAGGRELVRRAAAEGATSGQAMTPERWRQIEELYYSARERAPADRVAMLAQADPQLRRGWRPCWAQDASGEVLDRGSEDLLTDSCSRMVAAVRCPGAHLALGVSFRSRSRSGEEVLNSAKERAESPRRQQSGEKQS